MNPTTVTNEDFSVEQTVARLKGLLATKGLTLAASGAGLPLDGGVYICLDHVIVVGRDVIEHCIWQFERIMRLSREEPFLVPAQL